MAKKNEFSFLRNKLIYKLCIENMKAQSHLPMRISPT